MVYAAIIALLVSGCTIDTGKPTMSSVTLTEQDKGKTITLHQGDQVLISLKENPTTGYEWAVDKGDDTLLTLNPVQTVYTPFAGGSVGGGGRRLLAFDAQGVGVVHLQLKLWRSWQGDVSIVDRFDVVVQVQE